MRQGALARETGLRGLTLWTLSPRTAASASSRGDRVAGTASHVLDTNGGDWSNARDVVGVGKPMKAISAVRLCERDDYTLVGHKGVEVASQGMFH
jgi:hypothetical protein